MSYLQRNTGLVCLRHAISSPIARVIAPSRITWSAGLQVRRPLNTTVSRPERRSPLSQTPVIRPPPAPTRDPRKHQEGEHDDGKFLHDYETAPPPPPKFSTGKVIIGTIIGACTILFSLSGTLTVNATVNNDANSLRSLNTFNKHFVLSLRNIQDGRYYTLFTSTFTHGSLMHFGFNMVALWGFGNAAISLFGPAAFTILYVGSGLAGGLLQVWYWQKYDKGVPHGAVGASGCISGVFGAVACAVPRYPMSMLFIPMPMWVGAGLIAGVSIGSLKEGWLPGIGHAGHLGGLVFGALWWLVALRRGRIPRSR